LKKKLLGLLVFVVCAQSGLAQESIRLVKIESPIILDGKIDEPAWDIIPEFTPVQYEPVFMGEMSEVTRFKVGYDESFIYVAGELFTSDPSTITTNSLTRDKYSSDDVFAIVIDGFNDNQNATWFFTNPDGVRFDVALSNDADFGGGRNAFNDSWNAFWDVETTITDEGWFAEMRIPFSSIGVQEINNTTEMGIIVYRWITKKNERHIFPAIPPNWNLGNAKPSQAQDVILEGVKSKNPLYITPYGLGGINSISTLNSDSTQYTYDNDFTTEVGFDLKYNVTSNLTLDATVNTDFAQVEADDQQLNLSRFSLFFPEKRQFFQQRSGLFDFSFGRDQVFYSRRIGLDGDGNPVRILGGGRLTGRVGDLDIGLMSLQTAESDNLPSENFSVLRLRKQAFNTASYLGGIFTSRLGADGSSNIVYGFDGDINTISNHYIEFRVSQSVDDNIASAERYDIDETSALRLSARNVTSTGFGYQVTVNRLGDQFNPDVGFVRVGGTTQKFVRLSYGWLPDEESVFQRTNINAFYFGRFYNDQYELGNFDTGLQSRTLRTQWSGRFKQYGELNIEAEFSKDDIPAGESFDLLGKIFIPSQIYETSTFGFRYQFSEAWKVGGDINGGVGNIYDGNLVELAVSPRFFVSRKVEIGGSYRVTHLTFPERANRSTTEFTSHLGQFRGQYAFDKKATFSAFIQYSNVAEQVGANFRFRYNFSEGRDFFLVINEQSYTNRDPIETGLPRLPVMQSGSVLLKYTHTFIY
tara:strand:- start:3541 stop:5799 length:2259 start_codon:yes stop_codon:yes gene_type:complete